MGCQPVDAAAAAPARTINALLLRQVLHQIETHPDTWDQAAFRCDTGMCFAGWAAQLAGGKWLHADASPNVWLAAYLVPEPADPVERIRDFTEGRAIAADHRAVRVLGLTDDDADGLFASWNGLAKIRDHVAALVAQVHHVTIRIVPDDELIIGEALPDGRSPLEVIENRPGDQPMFHGGERGIPLWRLADHARLVADRLGVDYIDPIDPAALERLTRAEAA